MVIIAARSSEVGVLAIPVTDDCFNCPGLLWADECVCLSMIDMCKADDEWLTRCLNALYECTGVVVIGPAT